MADAPWRLVVVKTLSGERVHEYEVARLQWSSVLNGAGRINVSIPLSLSGDGALTAAENRRHLGKWSRTLVLCWGDTPVEAYLITATDWDSSASVLDVSGVSLRGLFRRRLTYALSKYESGRFSVSGESLTSIAKRATAAALLGVPRWRIRLAEMSYERGAQSRTVEPWEFKFFESILSEVSETEGGVDMDFRPRWSTRDQALEWEPVFGAPRIAGRTWSLQAAADESGLHSIREREDASEQLTGVYANGEGSGELTQYGQATELPGADPELPYLDAVISVKDEADRARLDAAARAHLVAHQHPVRQFTITVAGDGAPIDGRSTLPTVGEIRQGDTLRVLMPADAWLEERWLLGYIIGRSGDLTAAIQLEMQEA